MQTMTGTRINRRYEVLEILGKGGMGVVYRAQDLLNGRIVALKSVKLSRRERLGSDATVSPVFAEENTLQAGAALEATQLPEATSESATSLGPGQDPNSYLASDAKLAYRLALAQEFRTLASLRHPNIIHVLDYGFSEGQPYFTMELLEQAQPLHEVGAGQPLPVKLALISQLLHALSYLHRHRILHRDLKPTNILVVRNHESLQVKVLDFGLALAREEAHRLGTEISGTLAYVAPEQWLGAGPSESSDLYAVGVMAYLMLTGRHPFEMTNEPELVMAVLHNAPDMTPLQQIGPVAGVIAQLLAKSPTDRYGDAAAVLKALADASGVPLSQESRAVRDCFLQAARFIGRQDDLNRLRTSLNKSLRRMGSSWLIGGESGVGKSRLLEELRAFALVQGALVVGGQAVSSGGSAYQLWPNVLRLICLHNDLSEMEASVLKPLVPDLTELLGRAIPDPPELDAKATQLRLIFTAESVVARQRQPLLIILEDLHWVDAESLLLLKRLLRQLGELPIMLVASFRDDESPHLPAELKDMQLLKLSRLSNTEMASLSESMLGDSGNNPGIVSFIIRETEGNLFFAIEVVRALAEEAGELGAVGHMTMPKQVSSGGIKAVVQRRLGQVPEAARPLLRLAAVAGRQLDLKVLAAMEPELEDWLALCADKAVLEVVEERWRFAHDKLREGLLAEISQAEARALHQKVAQSIESVYLDSRTHLAALAFHYREAGETLKAIHYSVQAGEQALNQGALTAAATLLEQALALQEQTPTSVLQQVKTRRLLVSAQFGLGQLKACTVTHEEALQRLGKPLHKGTLNGIGAMTSEVVQQALHRCDERFLRRARDEEQRALLTEQLLLWWRASEAYVMLGNSDLAGYGMLAGLNLAERVEDRVRQVFLYSFMAYGLGMIPQRRMSHYYLRLAEGCARAVDEPRPWLEFLRMSGIINLGEGRFQKADEELLSAAALAQQLGDDFMRMFCLSCLKFIDAFLGPMERQLAHLFQIQELAQRNQNAQFLAISQLGQGYLELLQGRFANCIAFFTAASEHTGKSADILAKLQLDSYRALAALRMGELKDARARADVTFELMLTAQLSSIGLLPGYDELCNIYLSLWEDHPEVCREAPVQPALQTLLKRLDRLASAFPAGLPCMHLMRGRFAWRCGLPLTALGHLRKSLQYSDDLKMLPSQAKAHFFLGRFGQSSLGRIHLEADSRQHLTAAADLFGQIGDLGGQERALRMRDGKLE